MATLTLADLHTLPASLMILGLLTSVFSYGFWLINEFYGTSWRLENAHVAADLWFQFAAPEEIVHRTRARSLSADEASKEAGRTAVIVTIHLCISFALSICALFDQFVDLTYVESPAIEFILIPGAIGSIFCGVLWIREYRKTLKIGWSA